MASSKDFAPLFTPIQGELIGFIVARGIPPSDADDVLQEAVTAMLERIDTFEIGSNFRAWAFAFVRNQSLAWRKRNRKRGLPISDELAETLGSTVMEETRKEGADREALRSCLEGLQPKAKKSLQAVIMTGFRCLLSLNNYAVPQAPYMSV